MMLAAIDWTSMGAFLGGVVAVVILVAGLFRWAHTHIVKPLRIVTGEPETADDPGKPSLYQLTKEAKETGEKALLIVTGNGNGNVFEVSDKALKIAGRLEKRQAEMQLSLDNFHEKGSITAQKAGEAAQKADTGLARIEGLVREIDGSFKSHVEDSDRHFATHDAEIADLIASTKR